MSHTLIRPVLRFTCVYPYPPPPPCVHRVVTSHSVRSVDVEDNPNKNFQSRLVFVYTKLLIVEMEDEYDSVVFLDADTLVLENIDELFECEPFCAVMRHSELLNSGVVVITPSRDLFNHMHNLIGELDSYTGG